MAKDKAFFDDYAGVAKRLQAWCDENSEKVDPEDESARYKLDVAERASRVAALCAKRPQERVLIDGRSTGGSWCFENYDPASGHAASLGDRLKLFARDLEQLHEDVRDSRRVANEVYDHNDTEALVSNPDGSGGGSGFAWAEHQISQLLSQLNKARNVFGQLLSRPTAVHRASTGRPSDTALKCLLNGLHAAQFSDNEIAAITRLPTGVVRTQIKRFRLELGNPPADVYDRSIVEAAGKAKSGIDLVTLRGSQRKEAEHEGQPLVRLRELARRNGLHLWSTIYFYASDGMRVAHKPRSVLLYSCQAWFEDYQRRKAAP